MFDSEGYPSHYEQSGNSLPSWIVDVLNIDDENEPIVEAIIDWLQPSFRDLKHGEEGEFSADEMYVRRKPRPIQAETRWAQFKTDILHGRRFFNANAKPFLDWLFADAETFSSYTALEGNQKVIRQLETGASFYRARRCDTHSAVTKVLAEPAAQLGAPPHAIATAGRMNPAGVPFFYGSFERRTCIAELRPPVGGHVVSAKFKLNRPLRVFDFVSLDQIYTRGTASYFSPNYHEDSHRRAFLKKLHATISFPVLPNDENEYVVTQVIAEYLAHEFPSGLDGVIFHSAQRKADDARNIVLFTGALTAIDFMPDSVQVHELEAVEYRDMARVVINGSVLMDAEDYDSEWDYEPILNYAPIAAKP
jgi:hypothetical protein